MDNYKELSDKELISRWIKACDKEAYSEFVVRYRKIVDDNIRYRFKISPADVEDVAQTIFVNLLEGLMKFKGKCSVRAFIFKEKHYRSIDWTRKIKKHKIISLDKVALNSNEDFFESFIEKEEAKITKKAMEKALKELPKYCQKFIKLFALKGLSYEEISKKLGIPVGTLGSRSYRCFPLYRKVLANILLRMGVNRDYFREYL